MKKTIKYIGLDVHKNSISIAIADQDHNQEVRFYGTIPNRLDLFDKCQPYQGFGFSLSAGKKKAGLIEKET